jgi:hypothetical protein
MGLLAVTPRMIDPTPADIGREVVYRKHGAVETGVVTSWNSRYVFVRYNGHTSAATRREDLEWATDPR